MPQKTVSRKDRVAQTAPLGREQELKPQGAVTGAGETSVPHERTHKDPDFGSSEDGTNHELENQNHI